MTFCIKRENTSLRGTLALCLADNRASQLLGGYKTLASAIRKCTHCMAVDKDVQTKA